MERHDLAETSQDRVRKAGLRPTRQRLALARLLFAKGSRHVTAESLHGEALEEGVRVSLATVYNTLHQFVRVGLLREVMVNPGRSYFDTNTGEHHHFFHEDRSELSDIAGEDVVIAAIPKPPAGTSVDRVDVIIRVRGR